MEEPSGACTYRNVSFKYEERDRKTKMFEGRIVIDSEVRHGKPIIKGTRVPVAIILGSLAGGMEVKDIAREYAVEREDVFAAIEYAANIIKNEEISRYA